MRALIFVALLFARWSFLFVFFLHDSRLLRKPQLVLAVFWLVLSELRLVLLATLRTSQTSALIDVFFSLMRLTLILRLLLCLVHRVAFVVAS